MYYCSISCSASAKLAFFLLTKQSVLLCHLMLPSALHFQFSLLFFQISAVTAVMITHIKPHFPRRGVP